MTEKEKYIGAFLDGYFVNNKQKFGMQYISKLNNAVDTAEKKWKQYKKRECNHEILEQHFSDIFGCYFTCKSCGKEIKKTD